MHPCLDFLSVGLLCISWRVEYIVIFVVPLFE